jgi:hypothetical protein
VNALRALRWLPVVAYQWIRRNRSELAVWSAVLGYLGILAALVLIVAVNLVRWLS